MSLEHVNEKIQSLLNLQVTEGQQIGVQVFAYKDGEIVVDAYAGQMGPQDPRPVQADSLFNSFSSTKGIAATVLHVLVDKGLIHYEEPVATYWPAFAHGNKEQITVAQAMSHQAGLPYMPWPFRLDHLTDWDAGIQRLEEGAPVWVPGTQAGYHATSMSWLVGGLVHGATGKHIQHVIRDEIAMPLQVEDELFVGIPEGVENRLTTLDVWDTETGLRERGLSPDSAGATIIRRMVHRHQFFNDMRVRKACLPSSNGHFSARALAKMYAALSNQGPINGIQLVSFDHISELQRVWFEGNDCVLGSPMRYGLLFAMGGEVNGELSGGRALIGHRKTAFGHLGAGGSIGFADPEVGLAVAVTLNKMEWTHQRIQDIIDLLRTELCAS